MVATAVIVLPLLVAPEDECQRYRTNSNRAIGGSVRPNLFSSSFNSGVSLGAIGDGFGNVEGTDALTGHSWQPNVFWNNRQPRIQYLDGGLGTGIFEYAIESAPGPLGTSINTLRMRMTSSKDGSGGRSQGPLLIEPGIDIREMYYALDFKTPTNIEAMLSIDGIHNWAQLSGWKTGGLWNGTEFWGGDYRAQLLLVRSSGAAFAWAFRVDTNANDSLVGLVTHANTQYIPAGFDPAAITSDTWYHLEHYVKRSGESDGLIWFKINGAEVGRFEGPNIGINAKPINRILIFTNYSGGTYTQTWRVANIEIRDTLPDVIGPAPICRASRA